MFFCVFIDVGSISDRNVLQIFDMGQPMTSHLSASEVNEFFSGGVSYFAALLFERKKIWGY